MKQLLKKFLNKKKELPKLPPGETELDYIPVDEIKIKFKTKKIKKNDIPQN